MQLLKSFLRERGGTVALAFGLSVVVMGLVVGLAIDVARVFNLTRKVQAALDAAALAGAKTLNEADGASVPIQSAAYAAFRANIFGIPQSEAVFSGFTAVPDTANSTVNVGVRLKVPSTFAKLAGLNEFSVQKTAATSYSLARIEVVLALDTTGSMNDTPAGDVMPKIEALKLAAMRLVDTLYSSASTDTNVRIALVPWSSGVQAGTYKTAVAGSYFSSGCLVERAGTGTTSDSVPGPLTYAYDLPASSIAAGYACPIVPVAPLAGRLESGNIIAKIASLTGAGGTAGHLGAAWAWWMVSPNWASLHPVGARPDPSSRNVIKAVILMTDGIFNTTHVGGVLGAPSTYSDQSYQMFKTICDSMVSQSIRVYTVAFDLTDPYALSKLAECSGSNSLTAATSTQLDDVFKQIAADLNQIRITR